MFNLGVADGGAPGARQDCREASWILCKSLNKTSSCLFSFVEIFPYLGSFAHTGFFGSCKLCSTRFVGWLKSDCLKPRNTARYVPSCIYCYLQLFSKCLAGRFVVAGRVVDTQAQQARARPNFSQRRTESDGTWRLCSVVTNRRLTQIFKMSQIIIITNSDEGWVKYSCERLLPQLWPCISQYRIVSARTTYERFYPSQPLCWKAAAFAHEINESFGAYEECRSMESTDISSGDDSSGDEESSSIPAQREIVSFGDGVEERTAVRIVADQLSATPKSVMFVSLPTPAQIVGQLHLVMHHMRYVCASNTNLDLEISGEQAERCAEAHFSKAKRAGRYHTPNVMDVDLAAA